MSGIFQSVSRRWSGRALMILCMTAPLGLNLGCGGSSEKSEPGKAVVPAETKTAEKNMEDFMKKGGK